MNLDEGFMNSRDAAVHVGYHPWPERDADGNRNNLRSDPQMRCFYAWCDRYHVSKHRRGRCLLFTRADLDRAVGRCTDAHNAQHQDRLEQMAALGRRHAQGSVAH